MYRERMSDSLTEQNRSGKSLKDRFIRAVAATGIMAGATFGSVKPSEAKSINSSSPDVAGKPTLLDVLTNSENYRKEGFPLPPLGDGKVSIYPPTKEQSPADLNRQLNPKPDSPAKSYKDLNPEDDKKPEQSFSIGGVELHPIPDSAKQKLLDTANTSLPEDKKLKSIPSNGIEFEATTQDDVNTVLNLLEGNNELNDPKLLQSIANNWATIYQIDQQNGDGAATMQFYVFEKGITQGISFKKDAKNYQNSNVDIKAGSFWGNDGKQLLIFRDLGIDPNKATAGVLVAPVDAYYDYLQEAASKGVDVSLISKDSYIIGEFMFLKDVPNKHPLVSAMDPKGSRLDFNIPDPNNLTNDVNQMKPTEVPANLTNDLFVKSNPDAGTNVNSTDYKALFDAAYAALPSTVRTQFDHGDLKFDASTKQFIEKSTGYVIDTDTLKSLQDAGVPMVSQYSKVNYNAGDASFSIDKQKSIQVINTSNAKDGIVLFGDNETNTPQLTGTYLGVTNVRVVPEVSVKFNNGKDSFKVQNLKLIDLGMLIKINGSDKLIIFSIPSKETFAQKSDKPGVISSYTDILNSLKRGDKITSTFDIGVHSQQIMLDRFYNSIWNGKVLDQYKEPAAAVSLITQDQVDLLNTFASTKKLPDVYLNISTIYVGTSMIVVNHGSR